jgi:HlyD family secretion protein
MSTASASSPAHGSPGAAAPAATPGPRIVRPAPGRSRWIGAGIWIILIIVAGAALAFYLRSQTTGRKNQTKAGSAALRTATVSFGDIQKTVQITGTVSAERFAAIIAPRLRGSRRDRGRGGSTATSLGSSTGAASTTSSGSSSSGSSTAGAASTTAANTSSLGALRGTTNRFNDAASTAASQNTTSSRSSAVSSADLGSTSGSLFSPSAAHDQDFSLVLVNLAEPGAHVKKGDMVAEFDRQYMLLRLDDYKDAVTQLEANVKKLKADLAVAKEAHNQQVRSAKADMDKAEWDLKTVEVRSAIESEEFKLNAEEARAHYQEILREVKLFDDSQRAQIRDAELELQQSAIELTRAENNVQRMLMRAPIDGVVVMQTLFRGGQFGQVQKGDQVWRGMNFMSIVDPSSMVVNATVNQADSELLRLGMKATVHLDAYPGMELPATVIGIGAMTKPSGWRPNYFKEIPVRLKLDRTDPRVLPDLTAGVSVVLGTEAEAPIIPLETIFRDQPDRRPYVFLRSPSGWVRKEVELGLANHVAAAVRSGVQKGDVLAAQRPL